MPPCVGVSFTKYVNRTANAKEAAAKVGLWIGRPDVVNAAVTKDAILKFYDCVVKVVCASR